MTIAIDFDGTCVVNAFPAIGEDIGAVPVLRRLTQAGHRLILWTVRDGQHLERALDWIEANAIDLAGVNYDLKNKSRSPKVHADIYIDDKALGAPLRTLPSGQNVIDWSKVETMFFPSNP